MTTVGQIAMVLDDEVSSGYDVKQVYLEAAFTMYGGAFSDLIDDIDDECQLEELRELAGDKWLRAMQLFMWRRLDDMMANGYFLDE